jgi:transcription antitermination factor NusG
MVTRGYPHFRVLQVGDRYARVTDSSLTGLRLAESTRAVKVKQLTLKPGAQVRMIGGLLDGLLGKVETISGRFAQVRFPGWHMPLATAVHLLEEVKA